MCRRLRQPVIVILCVLYLTAGTGLDALQGQRSSVVATRQTWEYKTLYSNTVTDQDLNKLGADGWELVATAAGNLGGWTSFIFKRPK